MTVRAVPSHRPKHGSSRTLEPRASGLRPTLPLPQDGEGPDRSESLVPGELADRERIQRLERRAAQTERLASIGTMAAGIAHEINTPLMYVLANTSFGVETLDKHVETLRRMEDAGTHGLEAAFGELAELRAALIEASEGVERVRTIVADLRRFARAEGVSASHVAVTDVVVRAARMSAGVVAPRARLRTELGRTPEVLANEGMLVQVLTNVLVNAAEAMGDGAKPGEILLRTRTSRSGEAVLEVLDDGPGFTDEALDRLFDPFFTTKPVGAGTGLGLSISHGAVRAMGGRITADNRPEGGAIVRIVLPPAPARASEPPTCDEPSGARDAVILRDVSHRARVLVVDDDPIVGRAIVRSLRTSADAQTLTSAKDAQTLLATGRSFDVILCDLMMPEVSGADLHAWICAHRPDLRERVVFLSGGATTEEAQRFLDACASPSLTKPVPVQTLRELVARYARSPEATPSE
ncbi:MAG: ATP-binding protein [Sandaracinus sp.]